MGKHSSPEQGHYYRSVAGWILPWALIAFVLAIAVLVAFDVLSKDPVRTSADAPSASAPKKDGPKEKPEPSPEPSKTPTAKPEPEPTVEPEPEPSPKPKKEPKLTGKGFDVQVLNGTSDADVDDLMADRLARLGFTVVAVEPAAGGYPETTVYFSRGSEEKLAEWVGEKYGWIVEPAPDNLSREVDLHVIVGDDEL